MRIRTLSFALSPIAVMASAQAQVMTVTSGDYYVIAQTQAVTDFHEEIYNGNSATSSFAKSAEQYSSFDDPIFGLHTAHAAASLLWNTSTAGGVTTLSGGVGGVAEAWSNGLDTYATGAAAVSIYFTVNTESHAVLDSQGTYNTDVFVLDNGNWVGFETGFNGVIERDMGVGFYKLSASAGESVSGSNYYSSGIQFSAALQAVPEPGTLVAVGLGMTALLIKRRSRGKA